MKTKTIKSPWNFDAPKYDDRNKQSAGSFYGVGKRNPVGKLRGPTAQNPKMSSKEVGAPPLKNN